MAKMPNRKRFPNATSIRLTREQRQLLRCAAGILNLNYQEYMRSVALTHAENVVRHGISGSFRLIEGIEKLNCDSSCRRIVILDNSEGYERTDRSGNSD